MSPERYGEELQHVYEDCLSTARKWLKKACGEEDLDRRILIQEAYMAELGKLLPRLESAKEMGLETAEHLHFVKYFTSRGREINWSERDTLQKLYELLEHTEDDMPTSLELVEEVEPKPTLEQVVAMPVEMKDSGPRYPGMLLSGGYRKFLL